jgi:hypothetical protein
VFFNAGLRDGQGRAGDCFEYLNSCVFGATNSLRQRHTGGCPETASVGNLPSVPDIDIIGNSAKAISPEYDTSGG